MNTVIWEPNTDAPSQMRVEHATAKYRGQVARDYDAKREQSTKWIEEQAIVEDMLSDTVNGDWVLDCPIGTGRFIPFYEKQGLQVVGVDISEDMLMQAAQKVTNEKSIRFGIGDIRNLDGAQDKSVDVAVMVRMTRWLDDTGRMQAMKELQRIASKKIVFTARVKDHPKAYTYEAIKKSLSGWDIKRDEGLPSDDAYRVIELEPTA